jgi:predicted DNA-binding transcriptional regulator AlpA
MRTLIAAMAKELLASQEFLSTDEFARLLRISKRTLFRLRAKHAIPEPVEISTNTIRWRVSDVQAYLESLQSRRVRPRRSFVD